MAIYDLDHVQVAMPPGQEESARAFYAGILELVELPKPTPLASRGGLWFRLGARQLHLGVEKNFRPARKAHPALLVRDLPALLDRCRSAGVEIDSNEPLDGYERAYVSDPFGNRLELLEPSGGGPQA